MVFKPLANAKIIIIEWTEEFINLVGPSRIASKKIITAEHVNKNPHDDCGANVFMNCDLYVFEVPA